MKPTHLSTTRRIVSLGAVAKTWAIALALGAILAIPAQSDMLRPVLSPGGINVRSNTIINTISVSGSNVTLGVQGLEAPYDVQVSSDLINWAHAGYTSIKWPNYTSRIVAMSFCEPRS